MRLPPALLLLSLGLSAARRPAVQPAPAEPRVGPSRGTLIAVGGGMQGPEVFDRFIAVAGGVDAPILVIPTALADSELRGESVSVRMLRLQGARNVATLHTRDRRIADSDSFVARLRTAAGVFIEGGRQGRLVDAYLGTRSVEELRGVLARGGVVGGSSAGASILASYLVRGEPETNRRVAVEGYEEGFALLRGLAIDQHVVARGRLRDLGDSVLNKHRELLGLSLDEGAAAIIRGDTAEIFGRGQAFVSRRDVHDSLSTLLSLVPGDCYDLGGRSVLRRAILGSGLTEAFVDSLFSTLRMARPGKATLLVSLGDAVLVDRAYGIVPHVDGTPATTAPNFALGGIAVAFSSMALQLALKRGVVSVADTIEATKALTVASLLRDASPWIESREALSDLLTRKAQASYAEQVKRRILAPLGMRRTFIAGSSGDVDSNVDELFRLELGLRDAVNLNTYDEKSPIRYDRGDFDGRVGWMTDQFLVRTRHRLFASPVHHGGAYVRIPACRLAIIVLTDDAKVDVGSMADRITERVLGSQRARAVCTA